MPGSPRRLQRWILAGLVLGLAAGLIVNQLAGGKEAPQGLDDAIREFIQPVGGIFLRLLFMTVVPLVVSCLALAVYELGDLRELGKIGLTTLASTLILSAVSVAIGLLLVNLVRPGEHLDPQSRSKLLAEAESNDPGRLLAAAQEGRPGLENIVRNIIPRNPVEAAARAFDGELLALMFFALLFGIGLRASGSARAQPVVDVLQGIFDVSMWLVRLALYLAPLGVAALVFSNTARMGPSMLTTLGGYVFTVLLGLAVQQFMVYPAILKFACGVSPLVFFRRIRNVMVTAFSTSSSNATLPTTLEAARDRLGIPPRIGNFVLTLGSTFNQNGTALYEGVTILFIAQLYGVHLSTAQEVQVIGMAILAGVGTAGVPGGSLPLLVPLLVSVKVPAQGIAVILGVDRLLDMCRTVLNVTGDLVVATFVARREGVLALPVENAEPPSSPPISA